MIAPRYIPTELQTINFDRDFKKHQRKLDEITKADRKKKVLDKEAPVRAKLYETREKNLKFHNSEKLLAIEKDNEILLGRLVEISRKRGANGLGSPNMPKTLNGPSRQREKDRIAFENEAFAKRLLSQQARFDRKKLETDYVKHLGLVKQMQRLEHGSTRKIKLPPLTKDQPTEEEKEDIAEEEERKEKEAKARKEKEDTERKEKEEKGENETKEKDEKEATERKQKEEKEAKERKEKEEKEAKEKEAKEKEEKEKKDKEEAERKIKEEAEKAAKTKEEDQKPENTGAQTGTPAETGAANQTVTKTPEELEKEKQKKEEDEKKKNEQSQ